MGKSKNDESNGQLSIFDGFIEDKSQKPQIGTRLIFFYEGHKYPCVVKALCGYDFFYIEFTDRQPADDNKANYGTGGWHISMRGYKESWDYDES